MRISWVAFCVAALLLACHDRSDRTSALQTSICSIAADAASFDGRTISVDAFLVSNGRDVVTLLDKTCPATTLLLVPSERDVDKSVNEFSLALMRGGRAPNTADRDVFARFTGVFRISPDGAGRRTLQLTRVSDVLITPKQQRRKDRAHKGS